ncbi:MAG: 4Fe-4S dicluster domain-containing protein [Gemmatimonadota bacterium]|nr:MAG: 4Fe-4S dicluster domain-containing protein [Gemmatimonadota bacterium]
MDRREFLKKGGAALAGTSGALGLPLLTSCGVNTASEDSPLAGRKWGMVIDLNECQSDCTACLDACRHENNVAFHNDKRWDIHWIRKVNIRSKESEDHTEKSVLLLCNHCENPPCAQVCPVQATYKRADGIVVVDHHRCIGCRYCMIACPYNARFFNYKENEEWPNTDFPKRSHGVAESCNFCAHLLDQGKRPACVEACEAIGVRALHFGDLNDPESDVSEIVASAPVKRIRDDWGTEPKVYYLGL